MIHNLNRPRLRERGRHRNAIGFGNGHAMHNKLLAIKRRERARPGLKAAPAIVKLVRGAARKIHPPVLAIEQRRERGELVVLRLAA